MASSCTRSSTSATATTRASRSNCRPASRSPLSSHVFQFHIHVRHALDNRRSSHRPCQSTRRSQRALRRRWCTRHRLLLNRQPHTRSTHAARSLRPARSTFMCTCVTGQTDKESIRSGTGCRCRWLLRSSAYPTCRSATTRAPFSASLIKSSVPLWFSISNRRAETARNRTTRTDRTAQARHRRRHRQRQVRAATKSCAGRLVRPCLTYHSGSLPEYHADRGWRDERGRMVAPARLARLANRPRHHCRPRCHSLRLSGAHIHIPARRSAASVDILRSAKKRGVCQRRSQPTPHRVYRCLPERLRHGV